MDGRVVFWSAVWSSINQSLLICVVPACPQVRAVACTLPLSDLPRRARSAQTSGRIRDPIARGFVMRCRESMIDNKLLLLCWAVLWHRMNMY